MPMWPTWWWPQALMQPEILIFSGPIALRPRAVAELLGDPLGDRNRARGRERAIVEARAGDDVADRAGVRRREADRGEPVVDRRQIVERDMRQDQVLLVRDADLVVRIVLGEVGDRVHLVGAGVARRRADRPSARR